MDISKLRRKINDSRVGRFVNDSIPGILFEGKCRDLCDEAQVLNFYAKTARALLTGLRNPSEGTRRAMVAYDDFHEQQANESNPEKAYSSTTRLEERATDGVSSWRARVPVQDAMFNKVSEYSPRLALRLMMQTNLFDDLKHGR